MARTGRPSDYTAERAAQICVDISTGLSVAAACRKPGAPAERTVYQWLAAHDDFAQRYARARLSRADARFESIDGIIDEMRRGKLDANQARVAIDAVKWQCGKEASNKYGDRLQLAGDPDAPLSAPRVEVVFVDARATIEQARPVIEEVL